jgi:hypothetical protein
MRVDTDGTNMTKQPAAFHNSFSKAPKKGKFNNVKSLHHIYYINFKHANICSAYRVIMATRDSSPVGSLSVAMSEQWRLRSCRYLSHPHSTHPDCGAPSSGTKATHWDTDSRLAVRFTR